MRRLGFLLLCVLVIGVSCVEMVSANPAPAPSAFAEYPTWGLSMLPASFVDCQLTYTLTLSSDAYIESGGVRFPITQIWGFFAVNTTDDDANDMTASGADIGAWVWDQHPKNGNEPSVAGWLNASKNEALLPPAAGSVSKQFAYSQFSFGGVAPVMGVHVSISVPAGATSPFGSGLTSSIIPKTVPEPSSVTALLAGVMGLAGLAGKRRRS